MCNCAYILHDVEILPSITIFDMKMLKLGWNGGETCLMQRLWYRQIYYVLLWVDDTHVRGRPFKRFQLHRISQPLELTTFSIIALCQLRMQATEVLKFCSRPMSSQNSGVMNRYTSIILVSAHLIFMLYPNKAIQNLNFEKCWRKLGNFEL